jgi:hypothetical protein
MRHYPHITPARTRTDWPRVGLLFLALVINCALWAALGRMAAAVWAAVS